MIICADRISDFIRIFARKRDFLDTKPTWHDILRRRLFPILGAAAVFIISLAVLYAGENVGLSDNGDFRRVLLTNNIEYADEIDHYYLFKQDYVMKLNNADTLPGAMYEAWQINEEEEIYSSPQFLIIKISKELNVIANAVTGKPLNEYNIAYLAILYIFMLSVAAGIIFTFFADSKLRVQAAVFVLFIFIFCDAGYLLYFNSFYGEPLQYTSLMLLIACGMLIYKRPSVVKAIIFFIALYFFAGTKLANIPYSVIMAALSFVMVIMRKDIKYKAGVIVSALLCMAAIISLYATIPQWMDRDTTYQSVFLGVVKDSDTPEQDLIELGTSPEYAALAGTHAYMEESEYAIDIHTPEFERNFYDKVSKLDIAWFYVKHPSRLFWELCHSIENSAYIRPPVVGNSDSVKMEFTDKFSGWSHLRVKLKFLYAPWVIFSVFLIITAYMIFLNIFYIYNHKIETPQRRYMIMALDILLAGLWINLVLPVLCNGEGDLAKHMFLFTNCVDILFAVGIAAIAVLPLKRLIISVAALAVFTGLFHINLPKGTVTLGTYENVPIKWEVYDRLDDNTYLLITKDCVDYLPYDSYRNNWCASNIRSWLNEEFLEGFTDAEKEMILPTRNRELLTFADRRFAEGGNHAHYWNFTRTLAADMADTAYYCYNDDYVFLPTIDMMKTISADEPFWIMCPYTSNTSMNRYMSEDGFVLHTEVTNIRGVRPVIRVNEEDLR